MRTLLNFSALVFTTLGLAGPGVTQARASAAAAQSKGEKKKKKNKKKSNRSKSKEKKAKPDQPASGSEGGPNDDRCELPSGVQAMVQGAGQRLSFSFGGRVWTRASGPGGNFVLALHPVAPQGEVLNVTCRYARFRDVAISPQQSRFTMEGRCQQVFTNGRTEWVDAIHRVVINNERTDSISVELVGDSGLAVPPGILSFGNFSMNAATVPRSTSGS